MKYPNIVKKYLSKQKSTDWNIELKTTRLFNNIIIIPALNETENIPTLIKSLEKNSPKHLDSTLVLIVVNNSESSSDEIKSDNKKLLDYLRNYISEKNSKVPLGIVDASSGKKAIPDKYAGVGIARKIGMDLALTKFNYANTHRNILISLDADCEVSPDYLESIVCFYNSEHCGAAIVGYQHKLPENVVQQNAIVNYELFLRYYVLGMSYANSKYSYQTIGSIITCDDISYVRAGGMNKRKAGEDFYFIEKLVKLTNVFRINKVLVYPSARISNRVPFGTGPRIKRFMDKTENEYLLYNPNNFEILKSFLKITGDSENLKNANRVLNEAREISQSLFDFLNENQFITSWSKILKNSKSNKQLQKQFDEWLDAFRTLKLIHYLRDKENPNINMFSAINILLHKVNIEFNNNELTEIPSLSIQKKYLELLRSLT